MSDETPKVVSELEWTHKITRTGDKFTAPSRDPRNPDGTPIFHWWIETVDDGEGGGPWVQLLAEDALVADDLPTFDAAKALAQRLQSVLSGDPDLISRRQLLRVLDGGMNDELDQYERLGAGETHLQSFGEGRFTAFWDTALYVQSVGTPELREPAE
jgi:hypothetical protein